MKGGANHNDLDALMLAAICNRPGMTSHEIAAETEFSVASVRGSLRRLEESGHVSYTTGNRMSRQRIYRPSIPPADVLRLPWRPDGLGAVLR